MPKFAISPDDNNSTNRNLQTVFNWAENFAVRLKLSDEPISFDLPPFVYRGIHPDIDGRAPKEVDLWHGLVMSLEGEIKSQQKLPLHIIYTAVNQHSEYQRLLLWKKGLAKVISLSDADAVLFRLSGLDFAHEVIDGKISLSGKLS